MIPRPRGEEYLPYQTAGIEFARGRKAALIGDEMGLGKTIQAIGWMNCHPEIETALVVCPATLKTNWARELDAWLVSPCVDVTITNYDQLHKLDMAKEYDVCILDEGHYIKNRKAKRSRLCRGIRARKRIVLTGTPILNKPVELWHLLHWLDPGAWPASSFMKYAVRYCGAHQRRVNRAGRLAWFMDGATNLDELRALLAGVMIRRLKSEVLKELPDKRRQIIEIPVNGLAGELITKLREATNRIRGIEETYAAEVQRMEGALSVAWKDMAELRHELGLAKLPAAIELIHDAVESSGKVVVFAHHRDVIEGLSNALVDHKPAVIHGGTPLSARQKMVDAFQQDPGTKVFIGQTMAAGVGITLTAASHVIFVELDWTPGVMSQAEDRCHRIGQKNSVLVQHLAFENSLDVNIAKALIRKQSIITKALDAGKEVA
jgi:SWI/SNF-related matrix-associated actin-dependent regulator of chromatin subfamily A-like protein 1